MKILDSNAFDLERWLQTGWMLEVLRPGEASLWVGWGEPKTVSIAEFDAGGGVWTPDFFELKNGGQRFQTPFTCRIDRTVLQTALQEMLAKHHKTENVAFDRVVWRPPLRADFDRGWQHLQSVFRDGVVKKAVPAVFARGTTATMNAREWLANRVLASLRATAGTSLRLYGEWSGSRGRLGATPEALFSVDGATITSMAVAGTRAVEKADELWSDNKEREEHQLVVDDIARTLSAWTKIATSVGGTRIQKFSTLAHLVTDISATTTGPCDVYDLTRVLHPTPALGTSPRQNDLSLLRQLHQQTAPGISRDGFGAPFVVRLQNRVEAVVAIRQIQWQREGADRLTLQVGSGCGVLPMSECDREWAELALKRRAIAKLFALLPEEIDNVAWSLDILRTLVAHGIHDFSVCAGARNAPLVVAIEEFRKANKAVTVHSFFDERSAAFFALGQARGSGRPTAVVTTSGTAVTELHSALAEADLSGVPLLALTADRPRRLRQSGAPQSIDQPGLFAKFVAKTWDLEYREAFDFSFGDRLRPLHVNLCYDEPLLSGDAAVDLDRTLAPVAAVIAPTQDVQVVDQATVARLSAFVLAPFDGFAVVGPLETTAREAVAQFILHFQLPCFLEGTSGLRGDRRLRALELKGGDGVVQDWVRSGQAKRVLRLGGVPTVRVWRDLDDAAIGTETLSLSHLRFAGLARGTFLHVSGGVQGIAATLRAAVAAAAPAKLARVGERWLAYDQRTSVALTSTLGNQPDSEPALFAALSRAIGPCDFVYVGNSLPIREWDLAASRESSWAVQANRGVNGIDGQISTAFGLLESKAKQTAIATAWIVVGDLTALYDLSAPWIRNHARRETQRAATRVRIVVINNQGGRIFSRVLAKAPGGAAPFENAHDLGFKSWAEMWGLRYLLVEHDIASALKAIEDADDAIVELRPSNEATCEFWRQFQATTSIHPAIEGAKP